VYFCFYRACDVMCSTLNLQTMLAMTLCCLRLRDLHTPCVGGL